ncbi:MAG: methyltransferase [Muribaculaceae bacterium]|nr:methyltransferase [Muribaculaceae bacterium]
MIDFAPTFTFKCFAVDDRRCAMKVGTDGVLLGAWASVGSAHALRVADLGAGSGLIALMLAQRNPGAVVTAVEIDRDAFSDLEKNIAASPFADRITAVEGDYRTVTGKFDLIVSNPPYFMPGAGAPDRSRCLAREAGDLSPFGLLDFAPGHLTGHGRLAMIAPSDYDGEIEYRAALAHLNVCRRAAVATSPRRGVTRTLWEFASAPAPLPEIESITVGSEHYRSLTSPFYLNF